MNHTRDNARKANSRILDELKQANLRLAELEQTEQTLRQTQNRYQLLIEHSPMAIQIFDSDGLLVQANRAWGKMWNLEPAEVIGKYNALQDPQLEAMGVRPNLVKIFNGEPIQLGDIKFDPAQSGMPGRARWVRSHAYHIDSASEQTRHVVLISEDITKRKQAKLVQQVLLDISQSVAIADDLASLVGSVRQHLGRIIDTTNFYIALYDEATDRYSFPAYFDKFDDWAGTEKQLPGGLTEAVRLSGKSKIFERQAYLDEQKNDDFQLYGTDSKCWLGAPLQTKQGVIGVLALQSYDDADAYTEQDLQLVDSVVGTVAIAVQRKQAEQALLESEQHLRESEAIGQIGSYIVDLESGTWICSPVLSEIFGVPHTAQFTSEVWLSLVHPDWLGRTQYHIAHTVLEQHGHLDMEYKIIRQSDGVERWVYGRGRLKLDDDSQPVRLIGTIQDITDSKQDQMIQQVLLDISQSTGVSHDLESLIKSVRQHLGTIIDTTNFYIALYDEQTGGYSFPTYFDQYDEWGNQLEFIPDSLTDIVRRTGKSMISVHDDFEKDLKAGAVKLYGSDSKCWLGAPLITKDSVIGVLGLQSYDDAHAYNERDLQLVDSIVGTIAIALERKQSEEIQRSLNEKLKRAERLESLGLLAGGVAHDLNNVLVPLVATPDLMLRKIPHDSPLKDDLLQIKQAAVNAATIISDLLTMARRGRYEMVPAQLNEIIKAYSMSSGFTALMSEHAQIQIHYDLDDNLKNVLGSETHMSKVVMNLIINAVHSLQRPGEIWVRTRNELIEKRLMLFKEIPKGEYVVFEVEDQGIGISAKMLERIFDPFYTTKNVSTGKGTGLGLSIVHGVVEDHDAHIDIDSEEGRGTIFRVFFPVTNSKIQSTASDQDNLTGIETVLVVDDMPIQIELVKQILTTYGYQVQSALGGRDAIEYLTHNEVDIVILDMIMEDNFDGLSTYREILKLKPGQKALVLTGFSESDRVKEAINLGAGGCISKPYTVLSLGKAVRDVLDS